MYAPILRNPAGDMRLPVLELVEAIEQNMPAELATAQRRTGNVHNWESALRPVELEPAGAPIDTSLPIDAPLLKLG